MDLPEPDAASPSRRLRRLFAVRLAVLHPRSVLDVGCGRGELLAELAAAQIDARGIEPNAERVATAVEAGLSVREATAVPLDEDDDAVDWVTLRHVPHHLAEPGAALAEALRVARSGVLVAEPCFDASVPSQHVAQRFDRWLKARDREGGMVHADEMSLGDLLAALAEHRTLDDLDVESETHVRLDPRPPGWLERAAAGALATLPPESDAAREFLEIQRDAHRHGVTAQGTLIVTLRKRAG